MKFEGFIGPSYVSRSVSFACQRSLNLFPEVDEIGGAKNVAMLRGTPGLHVLTTLPSGPVRALWPGGSPVTGAPRLFAAAGSRLYEVFSFGGVLSYQDRGDIGDDQYHTPVQIFPNGDQLFIVSAGKVYTDNGAGPVQPTFNPSGNPVTATTGCFLDGYFIAQEPLSKKFWISDLNDGTTWSDLDYGSKEGYPDHIVSILADHRNLWLFGDTTTEVWRNTGNANFPFQRDPSAFIHQGCRAPWSVVSFANSVAWIGGDTRGQPVAWLASGFTPERISTHAVEQAWSRYTNITDAQAYVYTDEGHQFWVIRFPIGNATWVYDATASAQFGKPMWHERSSANSFGVQMPHRGRCHAYVFGKHLVGDAEDGQIWDMNLDYYDDAGYDITRVRTSPHLSDEDVRIFYHRFKLDMEMGLLASPAMTLEVSDDGGKTWFTMTDTTAGALNEFTHQTIWNRLGCARRRVFRVSSKAAMRHAWIHAYLEFTKGLH